MVGRTVVEQGEVNLTLGPWTAVVAVASASQPSMREISWTSDLTSFAAVAWDRSWESLALRQGCDEMCTLGGRSRGDAMSGRNGHTRGDGIRINNRSYNRYNNEVKGNREE